MADDNATTRNILDALLVSWRMKPTLVESGIAALDALHKAAKEGRSFDVALLDATMSHMDGFQVAESMRRATDLQETPVIILGFARSQSDGDQRNRLGITSIVPKPANPLELLNAIGRALAGIAPMGTDLSVRTRSDLLVSGQPLTILLAEDQDINRQVAEIMLRKMGHHVEMATDGKQALLLHQEGRFDLILMDVEMPEVDGIEATRVIRERERITGSHVPIIAMTAHALVGDMERLLGAGMDGYLAKPISADQLFSALERFAKLMDQSTQEAAAKPSGTRQGGKLATLPGIDLKSALDRVCGDEDLFESLLLSFSKRFRNIPSEILAARDGCDFATVRYLVHTIKGVAGNLSAIDLHHVAEDLEQALESDDKENFQRLFDYFERTLHAMVQGIDNLGRTSKPEAGSPEELSDESTTSTSAEVSSILGKLSLLLRSHDTESLHVVRLLETALSSSVDLQPLRDLRTCLESFDFQGAQNELARLARMFEVVPDSRTE